MNILIQDRLDFVFYANSRNENSSGFFNPVATKIYTVRWDPVDTTIKICLFGEIQWIPQLKLVCSVRSTGYQKNTEIQSNPLDFFSPNGTIIIIKLQSKQIAGRLDLLLVPARRPLASLAILIEHGWIISIGEGKR